MGYSLVAPIVPVIIKEKGGTSFISGLFLSLFSVAQIIAIVYSPRILSLTDRKTYFIFFMTIQAIIPIIYSLFKHLNGFFFYLVAFTFRSIHGVSDGSLCTPAFGTTNIISRGPNLAKALSILEFSGTLGGTTGPLFVSFFYYLGGYPLPFIATTLISLPAIYYLIKMDFSFIEKEREKKEEDNNSSILPYIKDINIFLILLLAMTNFNANYFYYPSLSNYLKEEFNISLETASIFFTLPLVTYWVSLSLIQKTTDKIGSQLTMLIGLLVTFIGCLFIAPLSILPHSSITIAIGLLLQGYGCGMISIPLILASNFYLEKDFQLSKDKAGDISGAFFCFAWDLGTIVSTPIGGFINYHFSFKASAYFCAFCCLCMDGYYYYHYKDYFDHKIKELLGKQKTNEIELKSNFLNNI